MTERFPEQRNRSAQRRADAPQVSANTPSVEPNGVLPDESSTANDSAPPGPEPVESVSDDAFLSAGFSDSVFEYTVFDESFVAAARIREPSAEDRAFEARLVRVAQLALTPSRRWAVRPSHHLAALRLPVVAVAVCAMAAAGLLLALMR